MAYNKKNQNSKKEIDAIHYSTVYNFVPLSDKIAPPPVSQPSFDIPLKGGISGEIDLYIKNIQPISIGDKQTKASQHQAGKIYFFRTPNNKLAIPATSIKGAVRNILEIATFSRMNLVENKRFGYRDLQDPSYTSYFTKASKKQNNQSIFSSKVKAGWLQFKEGEWLLTPTEYHRIEHSNSIHDLQKTSLEELLNYKIFDYRQNKKRPISKEKYKLLLSHNNNSLAVQFESIQNRENKHNKKTLIYNTVTKIGKGSKQGYIVLTGQPGPNKHLEFIFEKPQNTNAIKLDTSVANDFLNIYKETEEWKNLNKLVKEGKLPQIPVFYILDDNRNIKSLGLSQLFKIAVDNSIYETIQNTNADHLSQDLDFTTALLGHIDEDSSSTPSLKGRVNFSLFRPSGTPQTQWTEETISNEPKATFYPNYLQQTFPRNQSSHFNFSTYLAFKDKKHTKRNKPKISGWKRYLAQEKYKLNTIPPNVRSKKTLSKFEYVKNATLWKGKLRFHNISTIELGALLWIFEQTNSNNSFIQLGHGKNMGFGGCHFMPQFTPKTKITTHDGKTITKQQCIESFTQYMELHIPDWKNTPQIKALIGMMNIDKVQAYAQKHQLKIQAMPLDHHRYVKGASKREKGTRYTYKTTYLPPFVEESTTSSETTTVHKDKNQITNNPFAALKKG